MIEAGLLEQEYLLCTNKEGVMTRKVSRDSDVVEVSFRAEARRTLNTKFLN